MLPFPGFRRRASRCGLCTAVIIGSILAATAQAPSGKTEPRQSAFRLKPDVVGVADPGSLWPGGTVFYQIAGGSGDLANINAAITTFNNDFTGVVHWTNGTGSGTYVEINLDPNDTSGACDVNTIGYPSLPNTVVSMAGSGSCSIGDDSPRNGPHHRPLSRTDAHRSR